MYEFAEQLIERGHAYVDSAERRRDARDARHADRARQELARTAIARADENLELFARDARRQARGRRARAAREDRHGLAQHQPARPGDLPHHARRSTTAPATSGASIRCTTYAHPIEDALENITHSLCTLEFEDQRPFYDWLLERLAEGGLLRAAAAAADRVRAPQPHLRRAFQAQADPAGRGKARRRLGRPAHADARRRAPPRLHARGLSPVRRAHRRLEGRLAGSTIGVLEDAHARAT